MQIAIIGLGLIGGSLALALKAADESHEIIGFDTNNIHCQKALERGIVQKIIDFETAMHADVVVLAVPVDICVSILKQIEPATNKQTFIDVASTKSLISTAPSAKNRFCLVAAHPMAGTEYSGPDAAQENLFQGKTVVLCDLDLSGEHQKKTATTLFESIGMHIVTMDAKTHDTRAAYISHLPHILSFSLANAVLSKEEPEGIVSMAASGFRDMSRLAKSRPDTWVQIFRQNKTNLLESLQTFEESFYALKSAIQNDDWQRVEAYLEQANQLHSIFRRD